MKIYLAGVPGGAYKTHKKRISLMKNRLLSYYFINIEKPQKKEFENRIINEKSRFHTSSRT